jgi:hypothetical protein
MHLLEWFRKKRQKHRIARYLQMKEPVARALSDLIGPMMSDGYKLDLAEGIAKIRAFKAGDYEGEPCESCGHKEPVLMPTKMWDGMTYGLCHACSDRAATKRWKELHPLKEA